MKKLVILGIVLIGLCGAALWAGRSGHGSPALESEYQAVLLSNGSVYFGRLEGLGSAFPVLREVYYVQSGMDPETKQAKNILLKRGSEWHKPDYMILDARHMVLVEPVGKESTVRNLIEQIRKGK